MKRQLFAKWILVLITVISLLWVIILVSYLRTYDKVSRSEAEKVPVINTKPLTSMSVLDTASNIRICKGDTLNVMYRLVNTGKDSLYILDINPDCTCTDFRISSYSAAPEDTVELKLVIDTNNKFGKNLIHVVIQSNTEEKYDMIKLQFIVDEAKSHRADSIDTKGCFILGNMKRGVEKEIGSYVFNNYSRDVIVDLMTSCSCIRVSPYRMYIKTKEQCPYSIVVRPDAIGEFDEYLILRLSGVENLIKVEIQGIVFE